MIELEVKADRLLKKAGNDELVSLLHNPPSQVFEPFRVTKLRGTLSGPAPKDAQCIKCFGPRRPHQRICQGCVQLQILTEFEQAVEYWEKLERRQEPDFSKRLIEQIAERERSCGRPAAFWGRGESVLSTRRSV